MWNFLKTLILVTFLLTLLLTSEAAPSKGKKKGHKKAKATDPEKSSSKRPQGTSAELYCNACQAITRELLKKLRHRTSESDVVEALDDICNPQNFMVYEFPPPEMREGCEAFIMDWEEVFEKEMQARTGNDAVEERICTQVSKACKNVNVKDAPKFDNQIFVDGQPVPVGQDGKIHLKGTEEHIEL